MVMIAAVRTIPTSAAACGRCSAGVHVTLPAGVGAVDAGGAAGEGFLRADHGQGGLDPVPQVRDPAARELGDPGLPGE